MDMGNFYKILLGVLLATSSLQARQETGTPQEVVMVPADILLKVEKILEEPKDVGILDSKETSDAPLPFLKHEESSMEDLSKKIGKEIGVEATHVEEVAKSLGKEIYASGQKNLPKVWEHLEKGGKKMLEYGDDALSYIYDRMPGWWDSLKNQTSQWKDSVKNLIEVSKEKDLEKTDTLGGYGPLTDQGSMPQETQGDSHALGGGSREPSLETSLGIVSEKTSEAPSLEEEKKTTTGSRVALPQE